MPTPSQIRTAFVGLIALLLPLVVIAEIWLDSYESFIDYDETLGAVVVGNDTYWSGHRGRHPRNIQVVLDDGQATSFLCGEKDARFATGTRIDVLRSRRWGAVTQERCLTERRRETTLMFRIFGFMMAVWGWFFVASRLAAWQQSSAKNRD